MASPSDNPLKRLIREIHRRSLWRVLGIYLVASWSVAVLPFADLSPGGDQQYFVEGLSEEIINAGELLILTYNVAGLPEGISGSNPTINTLQISPLLNDYQLVVVQEDFTYHDDLISAVEHPFLSIPKETDSGGLVNDGLNRMSVLALGELFRERWITCNGVLDSGSDCLAEKGFSVGTVELTGGLFVDVYNLHMDAGGSPEDINARAKQVTQILTILLTRAPGRAIIVAGDTNLKPSQRPGDALSFTRLLTESGLQDVCRTLACGDEDRMDRFMFRDGDEVRLMPKVWYIDRRFVTYAGEPLSDHEAVVTSFGWKRIVP